MKSRFRSLAEELRTDSELGLIAGAVAAVSVDGRVELMEAAGWLDPERLHPMHTDAIFWIASMTKPVTSVAALMLLEDGRLHADDPVAAYLPQFAGLRLPDGSAPPRPPTIFDLLTHTAGFTYGAFGASCIHKAYEAERVYDFGQTNAEMADKLARLPLLYAPGTTFEYGMSTDVLGRVIEVCSGMTLGEFLWLHIFEPLGMRSTAFHLTDAQRTRVAHPLPHEPFTMAPPSDASRWDSGGAGLWSTASDYLRFAQMLLGAGELKGTRILQPDSVRALCSNQLHKGVRFGPYTEAMGAFAPTPATGRGFGLGLSVRLAHGDGTPPGEVGEFTWPGVSGANFWCDPARKLAAVVMMQAPSMRAHYRVRARELVYRALP